MSGNLGNHNEPGAAPNPLPNASQNRDPPAKLGKELNAAFTGSAQTLNQLPSENSHREQSEPKETEQEEQTEAKDKQEERVKQLSARAAEIEKSLAAINNNLGSIVPFLSPGMWRKFAEWAKRYLIQLPIAMFKKAIENIKKFAKEHPYIFAAIVIGIIGLAGAGVTAGVLAGVGFTAGGVAAGSLAAAWQAMISNVAAGSAFAILQSLSATGLGIAYGGLFSGGLGAIWSVWRAWKGWFGTDSEENQHEDL